MLNINTCNHFTEFKQMVNIEYNYVLVEWFQLLLSM